MGGNTRGQKQDLIQIKLESGGFRRDQVSVMDRIKGPPHYPQFSVLTCHSLSPFTAARSWDPRTQYDKAESCGLSSALQIHSRLGQLLQPISWALPGSFSKPVL